MRVDRHIRNQGLLLPQLLVREQQALSTLLLGVQEWLLGLKTLKNKETLLSAENSSVDLDCNYNSSVK